MASSIKTTGTAATVDRGTSTSWTNPTNAQGASDTVVATCDLSTVGADYLVCTNFAFSIPTGATIHGVTLTVRASESGSGSSNYTAQLCTNTTPTLIGSSKTSGTVNTTTLTDYSVGSASDVWGATLTPATINSSTFGVAVWSTDTTNTLSVDSVTLNVEYSPVSSTDVGSLVLTGNAPTVSVSAPTVTVSANVGSLVLTGNAPTVKVDFKVSAGIGATVITGNAPTAQVSSITSTADVGSVVLTGNAPTASVSSITASTALGLLTIAGFEPTVTTSGASERMRVSWVAFKSPASGSYSVSAGLGSLVLTGNAPTVSVSSVTSTTDVGSLVLTGNAPTVSVSAGTTTVSADVGALAITGNAPTASVSSVTATSDVGSLVITGNAPTVNVGVTSSADVGSLVVTGNAPTASVSSVSATTDVGSLVITGNAPQITVSGVTVNADVGSVVLVGFAPSITVSAGRIVDTDVGSIIITGWSPTVVGGYEMVSGRRDAGGVSKARKTRKRRRFVVNVDGHEIVVSSEEEADQLLSTVKEQAAAAAHAQAERIVEKRLAKRARDGHLNTSPIRIDTPEVTIRRGDRFEPAATSFEDKLQAEIDAIYAEAKRNAEIILLMRIHQELDDDEAVVALLM